MKDSTPIRWGIIGPGRIAHKFASALDAVEESVLGAVASRDRARAEAFAETYGAKSTFESYEAIVEDSEVDAVYVATPHRYHYDQVYMCLEARKPVLCEKPLTVNAAQAEQLIELANASNTFLMEALWTRYLPIYGQVREWLSEGRIGEISIILSTFSFRGERDLTDRWFNHELAGGSLLDLGVYNVSMSQWVMQGDPVEIFAAALVGDTKVDEQTAVTLAYPNGAVSQFVCGFLSKTENELAIYGTEGSVYISPDFWQATRAVLMVEGDQFEESRPFRRNGFEYQIEEASRCIRSGRLESEIMPVASTLANMSIMDQIRHRIGMRYSFE